MRYHSNDADRERHSVSLSRREVLAAGAGVAAAHLIGGTTALAQSPPEKGKSKMKTRNLGKLEVSELGFGNMTLSGGHYGTGADRAQGIRLIRSAHERGV